MSKTASTEQTKTPTTSKPRLLSKVGPAQVWDAMGLKKKDIPNHSFAIAGKLRGLEPCSKDFNGRISTSLRLKGEFVFRCKPDDSENEVVLTTSRAFLPKVAEEMLENAFKNQLEDASGINPEIIFALRIVAREDETANVGYVYEVEPIMEVQNSSSQLLELLG